MSDPLRTAMRADTLADEAVLLKRLIAEAGLSAPARKAIAARGADLVRAIRASTKPGLMEVFLAEYGLSTDEGVALMCLAEALLRVPDATTVDALIEDKIAPSDWGKHLGRSASSLVNASTWALLLTGHVLTDEEPGIVGTLRTALKRLGEPVIRRAALAAMKEMGRQFVLGESIEAAIRRASALEGQGYSYSYDMLGEAARTEADARAYHLSYSRAIAALAPACTTGDVCTNPGISVKLSALHPRYERAQRARVMAELVARTRSLALLAKSAGMGFNIDTEEADRLDLSLDVIEAVLADPGLAGWDGFGVVVQSYGRRAGRVIDWLYALAGRLERRIMVRLVKGAYWDTEIKRGQVLGLTSFPVFTRKAATDVSYIANAHKLLAMSDRLYPQFATHNAHTVAAILEMAPNKDAFEFQRLHGMGERLHEIVHSREGTRCRIYAPVGKHRNLLAYLVRRLLENGANSSFVNQIVDTAVPPEVVAADPFAAVEATLAAPANPALKTGPELFRPIRENSKGLDLSDEGDLARIEAARGPERATRFAAAPMLVDAARGGQKHDIRNPADPSDVVGEVVEADAGQIEAALAGAEPWRARPAERAEVLARAAALYEANLGRFFALLAREAGKTPLDSLSELREAVDFLHYYGAGAEALTRPACGVFTCISPWNFPLAIFTGQIAAALAAGNAVLAKPAEQTPLIAAEAVRLLHEAGVPRAVLQLLPGGGKVGAALTSDARVGGVCFTGSTATAQAINRAIAAHCAPSAPLIAETGGLNAMIVDSTALPEQAVRDILASAFQSAGQRCSALRCLYLQEDIAEGLLEMLYGAMDELAIGDPWHLSTDIGPVIDAAARAGIVAHIDAARAEGRVLKELSAPERGIFVAPTVIRVRGIGEMKREIFGPVLHVATFAAGEIGKVIGAINASGYGLTFGLHSRIDDRVQQVVDTLHAGNLYVNRNQIGAVVASQPFGGEGLSGTGPKAGGPHYLARFTQAERGRATGAGGTAKQALLEEALKRGGQGGARVSVADMPGPTGESNRLSVYARGPILCLGPGDAAAARQVAEVTAAGGVALAAAGLAPEALTTLNGFAGVVFWGEEAQARTLRRALAARDGPILPLVMSTGDEARFRLERLVCVDTTASGGNAALLAASGGAA